MDDLAGKKILVTGGCGSIGSELVETLLDQGPNTIRIVDSDEAALFRMQQEHDDDRLRFLLGNVRDRDRLSMAMRDIDTVFHTAALKHVGLNEYNPFETIKTNVEGTQNIVRVGLDQEVDKVIAISTDKASNPISVMGATKLLSERLVIAANAYKGQRETKFGCVRFGNVLYSKGSVVPLFKRQIEAGGPVTVTDPDMTRFIMPTSEAIDLVLKAHDRLVGGETYVFKMPSFRVGDLATTMIDRYAHESGHDPDNIEMEITGPRPAERKHEKLISTDEVRAAWELDKMYAILPQIDVPAYDIGDSLSGQPVKSEYTSSDQEPMSRAELLSILEKFV